MLGKHWAWYYRLRKKHPILFLFWSLPPPPSSSSNISKSWREKCLLINPKVATELSSPSALEKNSPYDTKLSMRLECKTDRPHTLHVCIAGHHDRKCCVERLSWNYSKTLERFHYRPSQPAAASKVLSRNERYLKPVSNSNEETKMLH